VALRLFYPSRSMDMGNVSHIAYRFANSLPNTVLPKGLRNVAFTNNLHLRA